MQYSTAGMFSGLRSRRRPDPRWQILGSDSDRLQFRPLRPVFYGSGRSGRTAGTAPSMITLY